MRKTYFFQSAGEKTWWHHRAIVLKSWNGCSQEWLSGILAITKVYCCSNAKPFPSKLITILAGHLVPGCPLMHTIKNNKEYINLCSRELCDFLTSHQDQLHFLSSPFLKCVCAFVIDMFSNICTILNRKPKALEINVCILMYCYTAPVSRWKQSTCLVYMADSVKTTNK